MCRRSLPPVDAAHLDAAAAAAAKPGDEARPLPTYTRADLARHNSPSSAWCAIHHVDPATGAPAPGHAVLDVTAFAADHPGGDLILLAAGRDASVLFETYHPRGVPPALVARLTVGTMAPGSFADSLYSWRSDFYRVLKRRVVRRLAERGLARRGSPEIWLKALGLLGGFWLSLLRMYAAPTFAGAAAWAAAMGTCAALIGVNVQHDGNHGAFARSRAVNKAAGWTLDMIGASAFTWELQHMLGHHPYTNVLDGAEEERKAAGDGAEVRAEDKDQVRWGTVSLPLPMPLLWGRRRRPSAGRTTRRGLVMRRRRRHGCRRVNSCGGRRVSPRGCWLGCDGGGTHGGCDNAMSTWPPISVAVCIFVALVAVGDDCPGDACRLAGTVVPHDKSGAGSVRRVGQGSRSPLLWPWPWRRRRFSRSWRKLRRFRTLSSMTPPLGRRRTADVPAVAAAAGVAAATLAAEHVASCLCSGESPGISTDEDIVSSGCVHYQQLANKGWNGVSRGIRNSNEEPVLHVLFL